MGYIYKIQFENTSKVYIGQTTLAPKIRFSKHIKMLENKTHHSKKLQKEYTSLINPSIHTLEECVNTILNEREMYWIKKYDSYIKGYNGNEGGNSVGRGYKHPAAKYSEEDYVCILTFLAYTNWTLQDIANELDIPLTIIEGISSGKVHTNLSSDFPELYKLAISKSRKGMYQVTRRQNVVSPTGEVYSVYNVAQFEREQGLCHGGIRQVLLGTRKTHKGWKLAC